MIPVIKSEFKKLLSIRSTYILIAATLALIALFSYFGTSTSSYEEAVCESTGEVLYSLEYADPRLGSASAEEICGGQVSITTKKVFDLPAEKLLANTQEAVSIASLFVAITVVLLMAHEFRYNTINYTLTISNSRSKVLAAKLLVSTLYIVAVTLLAIAFSIIVTMIAVNIKNLILPTHDYDWLYITLRHVGYNLVYGLFFLGVATLVRNQVASIIAIFLIPTINGLGTMLLAARNIEPTKILPFSALDRFANVVMDVMGNPGEAAEFVRQTTSGQASVAVAGMVSLAWLAGLWLVTWVLFLKRDAN